MEGFEHLASASVADVLAVASAPKEHLPPDLGLVARVRQSRALSKHCSQLLARASISELVAALAEAGDHSSRWNAVAETLLVKEGALEELRGLLDAGPDQARVALHALYALACADAGWRDGKWKKLEEQPPIPALLTELRGHAAIKELAQEGAVQKGRADFVRKVYKRRHG